MNLKSLAMGAAAAALFGASAHALPVSGTGVFAANDDVATLTFTLSAATQVDIRSYGYAGGVMDDGTVIAPGGFDPMIWLFDMAGELLFSNDDGPISVVGVDPVTGAQFDPFLTAFLGAGDYTVAVTQYKYTPITSNIAGGFAQTDLDLTASTGCAAGLFCDAFGDTRTGAWALDVTARAGVSEVPLPAAAPMLLLGIAGIGFAARRKGRESA